MLDHVGVTIKSFVNPDKFIDNCRFVSHDGFDCNWDHVRSLLNPDRLIPDCDVVIQDGLVCTSLHAKSLLNPERLIAAWKDDTHAGRFRRSNHPKSLLKPDRATRFCVSFTQDGMEPPAVGIDGRSRNSLYDPEK